MTRIAKLWRGELHLAEAFWLWGVVGTVVLSVSSQFLLKQLIVGGFVSGLQFFNLLLMAIGLGYLVLVSVGIWRSGSKYSGLRVWPWASRGTVIAFVAFNAYVVAMVATHSPQDTNDPGKDSCNIESHLKPTAAHPLVGFWKGSCSENFGLAIDAQSEGMYSVSFCGPGGCFKPGTYRPHTSLVADAEYKVIDQNTIEVRGLNGFSRYTRCTKPFVIASADVQSNPAAQNDASRSAQGAPGCER